MSRAASPPAARLADARPLEPSRVSLFLDLDGTLAALEPRPQDVRPSAARTAVLRALGAALQGRLAVISGRMICEIDFILDAAVSSVAGVHGLQRRRADGALHEPPPHPGLDAARHVLATLIADIPGVLIEDKGLSLALHFRAAPKAGPDLTAQVRGLAAAYDLAVQAGDMVIELRTPGPDKGDAVVAFMAEAPFAGALPVFVGDDLTDEAGFSAATRLGGYGVLVGPARPTAARERLTDPEAVLTWLGQAVQTEARP